MNSTEFNKRSVYNYQYEITAISANEMKQISNYYKESEMEEEKELCSFYEKLMIDYKMLSHKYFLLLNPAANHEDKQSSLKSLYSKIAEQHKNLAVLHQNILDKLDFEDYFNKTHRDLHKQNASSNFSWTLML